MKLVSVPVDREVLKLLNTNNHYDLSPYIWVANDAKLAPSIDSSAGAIAIDKQWWETELSVATRALITRRLNDQNITFYSVDKVDVPHTVDLNHELSVVYFAYIESFDYNNWFFRDVAMSAKRVQMLHLTADEKKCLYTSSKLTDYSDAGLVRIYEWIEKVLLDCDGPMFMRLSGTSGKNERGVRPHTTAESVLKRMTSLQLFQRQEYARTDKATFLIMMPWRDNMDPKFEFRVFRYQGKTTAISQQHWEKDFSYSADELEAIPQIILKAPFENFPDTMVADVWVDIAKGECQLIECNPYGAHCGAGSALFRWDTHQNILEGREPSEFRVVSVCRLH